LPHTTQPKESQAADSSHKKLAVQWLNEVLCPPRRMPQNRQLLVAANRYKQPYQTDSATIKRQKNSK
jgi:hypothetical protein